MCDNSNSEGMNIAPNAKKIKMMMSHIAIRLASVRTSGSSSELQRQANVAIIPIPEGNIIMMQNVWRLPNTLNQ